VRSLTSWSGMGAPLILVQRSSPARSVLIGAGDGVVAAVNATYVPTDERSPHSARREPGGRAADQLIEADACCSPCRCTTSGCRSTSRVGWIW